MHGGIFILIQFLIIQNVYPKEILKIKSDPNFFENDQQNDNKVDDFMLIEFKDQRSITEVWTNIKNSALNAWNAVKSLANSTKEKIKAWILDVKERAIAILKLFKERLKTLKAKIDNLIQSILNNEDIQKCFKDETANINGILLDITNRVTSCISNKINGLGALEDYKMIDNILNDTKFVQKMDALLRECNKNTEKTEECLLKVRQDIFEETEALEGEILKDRQITRSFTDDILDAVISCSTDGLIESSAVIRDVALKIIQCISAIPA